ncbi:MULTISPECIES: TonB-dependent receptor [unclassified Pseudomonas]|uniref:TonB-dependent siderophore receptor n=1 Tax=unclassified Pseudomonas TaxID=196821 RepID=UPI000D01D53C|nr:MULTISPECIES: TonB-dependent receptor [unclassified Pseudomonas]PRN06897.1 ferric-pseudobactin receptor [Pseudomonas sp. LLC-1]PYG82896.1 outer membrane receptor for ferric coprogen and ferric-rhodotorulic acid [Pseudomonas sp. RV120224-01c]PYG86092.1 outer membrane receptor for ferric coprogen and ferric-rhodotorulic acid [Pseudomonas sp. RV120224-01b]
MHRRVTPHSYPRKPLVVAMFSAALLLQAGVVHPLSTAGQASAAEAARSYAIAAGPLGAVLSRFASDAGVVLSFEAKLTQGKHSPGLQGTYSVEQGFARLLAGSELQVMAASNGNYVLLPRSTDGALELGATSINAAGLGATTEGTGSYTTGSTSTATKMNLSIRETPQSISVITRQQMDDQHLASITDVLKQNPGITMSQDGGERFHIYSRGSEISTYQLDGVNTTQDYLTRNMPNTLMDMAMFDRIEIVRGATGLMTGAGEPNGVVNMVRKRPTREFQSYVQAGVGSWDYYRAEADVSGPLIESGKLRGRLVAAKQSNQSFMDWYSQDRDLVYGVLEADLTDTTTVRFGMDYQTYDANGAPGVPLFFSNGQPTNFSRSTSSGPRWMYEDYVTRNYSFGLDQELGNGWQLKVASNYMDVDRDSLSAFYRTGAGVSTLDQATGNAKLDLLQVDAHQVQRGANITLQGPFELFGRTHELVTGFDYMDYRNNHFTGTAGAADFNFYTWGNRVPQPGSYSPLLDYDLNIRQTGYFIATRLNFTDDLHMILGARTTSYRSNSEQVVLTTNTPYVSNLQERGEVTPYAGLIYDLNDEQSVYVSYTDIFKPQTNVDRNRKTLDPVIGQNYEMGWKGEFYNGRLNANAAIYLIKRDNLAVLDTDFVAPAEETWSAYKAVSGAETKGIDLELSGEVAPGLEVHTGYSHSRTEDSSGTRQTPQLPLDTFRLWTTFRMPGEWDRLTVGGGVNWNSKQSMVTSYKTRITQDDYAVTSLMARYKISENLAATLNVDNIFDKKYYAGLAGNYGHYGAPRNATLNLRYDF